jgi:tetratricopeptide (TPR) repeat protein
MKKHLSIILMFLLLGLVLASLAAGDSPPSAGATAEQFEDWALSSRTKAESSKTKPDFCAIVLERLQQGKFVTDQTILTCVTAWSYYEQVEEADRVKAGVAEYSFDKTLAYLGQVEPFLYGRRPLQAQLLLKKAYCFTTAHQPDKAISAYKEAAALLDPLHLQMDQLRIGCLTELADSLFAAGKKMEAEKLYLEVLSYPWFNVVDNPEALQNLRGLYVRAGRGLIECRRKNYAALKEIYFVPATREELAPFLDRAIAEAGK